MEASTSDEGGNLTMGVNGGLRVQGCWRTLAGNVRQNVGCYFYGTIRVRESWTDGCKDSEETKASGNH